MQLCSCAYLSLSLRMCVCVCVRLSAYVRLVCFFVVFLIVYMECENVVSIGKWILTSVSTKRRQNESKGLFDFIDDTKNG